MNIDQLHGLAKDMAGRIQEHAGKLLGSKVHQERGLDRQIAGRVQKSVGDVKKHCKGWMDDQRNLLL